MDKELHTQAQHLPALLNIGKNGVTDAFIAELDHTLEKKELVKIKLLRSFATSNETSSVAEQISKKLKAEVLMCKGNAITFYRKQQSL